MRAAGAARPGRATHRVLAGMIMAEVTLAIALVAGAGRLLLSMEHLLAIDPGFTADGRLAVDVLLPYPPYGPNGTVIAWAEQVDEELRKVGATSVAMTSTLPLRHEWDSTTFVDITDRPPSDPAHRPNGRLRTVSPNFFDVMHMKIVAGRAFTVDDRPTGAPVVVVNQAWVRRFIPAVDPLAQRIDPQTFGTVVNKQFVSHDAAIVGVVADVPYADLTKAAEPTVFIDFAQRQPRRLTLVVTAVNGHPEQLTTAIRTALARIDSHVPVDMELLARAVDASLVWPKLGLLLMVTFGGAALGLAGVGVFGVIAFVTTQRTAEMAVRLLALGGSGRHVIGLIVRQCDAAGAQRIGRRSAPGPGGWGT